MLIYLPSCATTHCPAARIILIIPCNFATHEREDPFATPQRSTEAIASPSFFLFPSLFTPPHPWAIFFLQTPLSGTSELPSFLQRKGNLLGLGVGEVSAVCHHTRTKSFRMVQKWSVAILRLGHPRQLAPSMNNKT